ncbi:uncharacterized protein N7458_005005 [Penicillium daleae]|uniref:Uncharacterized protein n=1 Tax=Penicillium daleae TaxID=63821 RepID=A0AAD6C7K9_9EURO|nr:uncharacterized protein N7458_005005 [Penicillium daleae]KAJ5454049.1 hypothetical protein N7458_005005 [Penicillium daleae]
MSSSLYQASMAESVVEQVPTDGGSYSGSPDPAESAIDDFQQLNHTSSTEMLEQYSVLWNFYMSEKAELHRIQTEMKILRSVNAQLCLRLQIAERDSYNQKAFLAYSEQRFANLRENLKNILQCEDNN